MPRTIRASQAGYCYHVLNRGNARSEVFHKPEDYFGPEGVIARFRRDLSELGSFQSAQSSSTAGKTRLEALRNRDDIQDRRSLAGSSMGFSSKGFGFS
jgi:hypothetical protein